MSLWPRSTEILRVTFKRAWPVGQGGQREDHLYSGEVLGFTGNFERVQERATRMMRSLEHLPHKERVRDLNLAERRYYKYLNGKREEDGAGDVSATTEQGAMGTN